MQLSAFVGSRLRTKRNKDPENCLNPEGNTAVDAPVPSIIILPGALGQGLTHEMANESLNKSGLQNLQKATHFGFLS